MNPKRVFHAACAAALVAVAASGAAPAGLTLTEFRKQSAAAAAKANPPVAARYRPALIAAYPPNVFHGGPGAPMPGAWPIRLSPDGRKAAFYWHSIRGGGLVYVDRKTTTADRILAQDEALDMAFSPDGRSLAMVMHNIEVVGRKIKAQTAELSVVELASGKTRPLLRCPFDLPVPARKKPASFIASCGWVGTGKIAAYVVESGKAKIVLIDVASRVTKVLFDCAQAEKQWSTFREASADELWRPWGQRLSVTGRGEVYFCWKGRIFRTAAATGKTELLADPVLPGGCSSPLADAAGRRFLVAAGDDEDTMLMLFDRDFGGGRVVTSYRTGGAGLSDNFANWFADGKHLAVADRGSVVLAAADGRQRVKIPLAAGQTCLGVVPIGASSLVVCTSSAFWRIDVGEPLKQLDAAAAAAAKQPKYPDFATPKAAIRTCLEAVRRKDMKTLLICIVPNQKAFLDKLTKQAGGDSRRGQRVVLQLALTLAGPCELGEPRVRIEGDTASAVAAAGATVSLVKRDGQWKIDVGRPGPPGGAPSPAPPRAAADAKPDISALIRALRKDSDADSRSRAVTKLCSLLWHLRRTDESRAREVLPQLLAVGSDASVRLVLMYFRGFYDSVDPKTLTRLRTLARKSLADAKANRFLRIRSALFLGAKGEQADVGLLRKVLDAMGQWPQYRWEGHEDFQPQTLRQAVWIGLARLGDAAAKRHLEGALSHAEVTPRLWGMLAAVHAGGREWIDKVGPLLDDAREGMLVMRERRVEGGDFEMTMSVAAVAARAIYTLARPKPRWSFAVQPFGMRTDFTAGIDLQGQISAQPGGALLTLSDAQRKEIRRWIKRSAVEVIPIVFDLGPGQLPPLPRLALAGKRGSVCGMLCNVRFFEESPQRQCLLSFPPGRPLAQYTIELSKPIRKLPASYPQFTDPPDKNLAGLYSIIGRLDAGQGNTYRLTVVRAEPMKVDAKIMRLCEKTVADRWPELAPCRPSVPKESPRPPSLGEFVKRVKPRLMGVSVDGGQLLLICALGRALLPIHAEVHARVYCHVDVKAKAVLGIYVRSGTTMLE